MSSTRGPAETMRADHERWQAEALRSIKRERFSRVTGPLYRERVSHPYFYVWTDEEGTERCHGTRAEAVDAITDRYRL